MFLLESSLGIPLLVIIYNNNNNDNNNNHHHHHHHPLNPNSHYNFCNYNCHYNSIVGHLYSHASNCALNKFKIEWGKLCF